MLHLTLNGVRLNAASDSRPGVGKLFDSRAAMGSKFDRRAGPE